MNPPILDFASFMLTYKRKSEKPCRFYKRCESQVDDNLQQAVEIFRAL